MVLELQPSVHNKMLGKLGKRSAPSSAKTKTSPSKRLKSSKAEDAKAHLSDDNDEQPGASTLSSFTSPRRRRALPPSSKQQAANREIPDTDAEAEDGALDPPPEEPTRTDLEQALPPIKTDKEAIQEYEQLRASEGAELAELSERLGKSKWTRGKSSIYVDAFNLALETVLEEESHLFDAAETKVFSEWRALSYEAQYLCVVSQLIRKMSTHYTTLGMYAFSFESPMRGIVSAVLVIMATLPTWYLL